MTTLRLWLSVLFLTCVVGLATAQAPSRSTGSPPPKKSGSPGDSLPKSKDQLPPGQKTRNGSTKVVAYATQLLFSGDTIPHLKIELVPAELQKLQENNRVYVRCNITENDKIVYKSVGIKLKGAAGSFREFDDRPALTINMDKFSDGPLFHDLRKFHLNNSVQDESYLNELLCSELFLAAGVPATRVTHARVWLNGRDVGLYVLKEGFDKKFLARHFADPEGNLYDGGFLQDVDVDLEKDSGAGLDDRSDLHALRDACAEPDPDLRWKRIEQTLNVDQFLNFMALELMTCHWDGYTVNKNNYRIYFDPRTSRAHFLPHGMDQMFGDAGFSVLEYPSCLVSSTVMQNVPWRKMYRARLNKWLSLFAPPTKLLARVEVVRKRLLPVIQKMGEERTNDFNARVDEVKQRLIDRSENLLEQVFQSEPEPLEFNDDGFAELPAWYAAAELEAIHEQPELEGPLQTNSIKVGPDGPCIASWRHKALLQKGRYQFQAKVKTDNVTATEDDRGKGVGLRISGEARMNTLSGTTNWTLLTFEFEILEEVREVELVAEMRATTGQVWFDASSMRLKKLVP